MEYLDNTLSADVWMKSDANKHKGFMECNIRRTEALGEGCYRYSIIDGADHPRTVTLDNAPKGNPLKGVANCDLVIHDNSIVGINIDGHCVMKKDLNKI